MAKKKPKSFRFNEDDVEKLNIIHNYFKNKYETRVKNSNMNDLYRWTQAQTLAVLIRDRYEELIEEEKIEPIEK